MKHVTVISHFVAFLTVTIWGTTFVWTKQLQSGSQKDDNGDKTKDEILLF
ncbi:MAG: hypothetical protein ACI4A7_06945 [Prevotella sp.]